jgi:ABC-type Fe3+-hydroxamate transport system substrate-binding protein
VPSQTELLFDLGLGNYVVGITKFCIHPINLVKPISKVGGTKNLNISAIIGLKPHLILANKEENNREDILQLSQKFPIWVSEVSNYHTALEMIEQIGNLTQTSEKALELIKQITFQFDKLIEPNHFKIKKAIYLIWHRPYMTVGGDTFISDMMARVGLENVVAHKQRYPQISIPEIVNLNPEYILLSSEPFPFAQKHKEELAALVPSAKIILVDGEMFSWYGSRMIMASYYFAELREIL